MLELEPVHKIPFESKTILGGVQYESTVPIIKDRVVQMAVKLIIEPLYEADFLECSYGFRPKRSAHQALDRVRKDTKNKGWWVVDADIKGYFNNINHDKLMLMVKQRISDRRILKMIWQWLKSGVMDKGVYAESELGSPQGGGAFHRFWQTYICIIST